MKAIRKIKLDLTQKENGPHIHAVQGDGNTRAVEITLLSDGVPWQPDEGWEAAITYRKQDGTKGFYNLLDDGSSAITISGSTATVILAAQMLTVPGTVRAAIVFNNQRLDQLTSFPFIVSVARNQFAGAQQSEDYIRLQWLENKLEERIAQLISTEEAVRAGVAAQEATAAAATAQEKATAAWDAANTAAAAASRADTAAAAVNTAKENADTAANSANAAAAVAREQATTAENAAYSANAATERADAAAAGANTAKENADTAANSANAAAAAAQEQATTAENAAYSANAAASLADTAATGANTAKENADTAASAANTAAAAAQEKATAAENAAASANTAASRADDAADGANTAKENADTAANSANAAAAVAQAAVDGIVPEVEQLRSDLTGITPDDGSIDGKPWTSKKTVDTLCQPFEEVGNPVQFYPVEGYPLGVKIQIEPKQDGEGDPSPENIRPITGMNSVSVNRSGKNLVESYEYGSYDVVLARVLEPNTNFTISFFAEAAESDKYCRIYFHSTDSTLIHTWVLYTVKGLNRYVCTINVGKDVKRIKTYPGDFTGKFVSAYGFQVEYGDLATDYEPYSGETYDIALPETVYGGTLDVNTGLLTVDRVCVVLSGEESIGKYRQSEDTDTYKGFSIPVNEKSDGVYSKQKSSHFQVSTGASSAGYSPNRVNAHKSGAIFLRTEIPGVTTIDSLKQYLASQFNSGTPVQVYYYLADPFTIQLTPQQITALSGVNTIYTDADGVIVTGREDPQHTITQLKNAILSLGGNI